MDDYMIDPAISQAWTAAAPPASLVADRKQMRATAAHGGGLSAAAKAAAILPPSKRGGAATSNNNTVGGGAPSSRADYAGAASKRTTTVAHRATVLHPVNDEEGLLAQVQTLKKELSASRAENKLLRVGKERMENELRKAEYESEQALKTGAIVDGTGPGGARPEVRLLKQLKAKTRELQEELQSKEAQLGELSGQSRGVRVKELEMQTKVYLEEARRLKEVSRLQAVEREEALQAQRESHEHALQVKEQQLETLRAERARIRAENSALDEELGRWMDENEMLRGKVTQYEQQAAAAGGGAGGGGACGGGAADEPTRPSELRELRAKAKDLSGKLRNAQRDKERIEADKVRIAPAWRGREAHMPLGRTRARARRCFAPPRCYPCAVPLALTLALTLAHPLTHTCCLASRAGCHLHRDERGGAEAGGRTQARASQGGQGRSRPRAHAGGPCHA